MEFRPGMILIENDCTTNSILPDYCSIRKGSLQLLVQNSKKNDLNLIPEKLQWINVFYPIFLYQTNSLKILTSDFSLIAKLIKPLYLEIDNLQEFVLFNTNLGDTTFYKNVTRHFNVKEIITDNSIKLVYSDNHSKSLVKEVFLGLVTKGVARASNHSNLVFLSGGNESRINAAINYYYKLDARYITWGNPNDKEYLIAKKISSKLKAVHYLIRPNINTIPYEEFLEKTAYQSVMQYAYRYNVVKLAIKYDSKASIWTGWGDINGFPVLYQPTEMVSTYFLSLFKNKKQIPKGWNKQWLQSYNTNNCIIHSTLMHKSNSKSVELIHEYIAPRVFGQVLVTEETIANIIAPWFAKELFDAVRYEESLNPSLITSKRSRVIWKGNLYNEILSHFCASLNIIKNSKGYYPFLFHKRLSNVGFYCAAILNKINSFVSYPTDLIEDRDWLANELSKILEFKSILFNKSEILDIINQKTMWKGNDIFEYFKLIQISWLLNKHNL